MVEEKQKNVIKEIYPPSSSEERMRMNCGKSERKSRRSSILKAPKACQPLENAELDESSGESSPETTKKMKRRVSFAEKKHVKEFCDSMEQGTVWDNTYEESELSQRNSHNSNSDDNQLSYLHQQLSNSSTVNSNNSRVIEDAERVSLDNLGASNTARYPSSSNGNEISEAMRHRTKEKPPNAVDEDNCNEAASTVLVVPILTSKDVAHVGSPVTIAPNTILVNVDSLPKEHTETNDEELVAAKESAGQATFTIFHDDSMEMTEAMSDFSKFHQFAKSFNVGSKEEPVSVTAEKPMFQIEGMKCLAKETAKGRTEADLQSERSIFHDKSMDFTQPVPMTQNIEPSRVPPTSKTIVFDNGSMDFTNVIESLSSAKGSERTTIFENESVDFTRVVENVADIGKSQEPPPERTTIFCNESLEFTEVASLVGSMKKSIHEHNVFKYSEAETERMSKNIELYELSGASKSMSRERTITSFNETIENNGQSCAKTPREPLLEDTDSEIRSPLPKRLKCLGKNSVDVIPVNVEKQPNPKVFDVTIPEVTQKLSMLEAAVVLESGTCEITDRPFSEKTHIFHDQSMEMTNVVPVSFRCVTDSNRIDPPSDSVCTDNRNDDNGSVMGANATLLNDESMEITCAIPSIVRATRYNVKENSMITTIGDQSMEMTVPVSAPSNAISMESCIPDCAEAKTTMFSDDSMDLTANLRAVQYSSLLNRINKNECQTSRSNTIAKLDNEDGTVMSDEFANKENCPVGAVQPREGNSRLIHRRKEMAVNVGSQDITGVVPFLPENEDAALADEDEKEIFEEDRRSLAFRKVEMEMSGIDSPDCSRLHRPPERATFSPAETIHRRSGQVAKELFQKSQLSIANERRRSADLEAVIKKINYEFAVEDESGFDQATFLRQQARCMQDYEANSTASQECCSATLTKFNETVNSLAIENRISIGDNNNFSSKSLEELRCRAETIGKFRVESTMTFEDLRAIEAPSIALENSATIDHSEVAECELSSNNVIFGKSTDRQMSREATETILRALENVPNVSFDIPRITSTQTIHMESIVNDKENNETTKNSRLSNTGLTTAAEFTSESPDGPSEKLRRRESVGQIDGKDEQLEKLTSRCESKDFPNSTAVCMQHHYTRQSLHRGTEKTLLIFESSPPDERNINPFVDPNPFSVLKETVEHLAARFDTIWTINRLDEKMMAFNFFSDSIVLAVYFNEDENATTKPIKVIGFLSQLVEGEGTDPGVSLAHSLIMKKISSAALTSAYRIYEEIPRMLEYVTTQVKLAMDFMFELDRLRDCNVMEIHENRIQFLVRTSDINAGIIFNLSIQIKPFEEINCNDITLSYILGNEKVRENDIKGLMTNVKRDHSFLRCYINDVKDYVDLMAETAFSTAISQSSSV